MNKNGFPRGEPLVRLLRNCLCSLTWFWNGWCFFLRLDICFSQGESEGLKKQYMTNTTWREVWWQNMNWWKFSLQGVFFVGLLYRFGNSSPFYPKQLQVCYSMFLLRFVHCPPDVFQNMTYCKDPRTLNNQYFNGKVRNCVFFLTVPQGGELDSRVRMCRKKLELCWSTP